MDEDIDEDEDEMKGVDESVDTSIVVNNSNMNGSTAKGVFTLTDVLAELDRTKRELQS